MKRIIFQWQKNYIDQNSKFREDAINNIDGLSKYILNKMADDHFSEQRFKTQLLCIYNLLMQNYYNQENNVNLF